MKLIADELLLQLCQHFLGGDHEPHPMGPEVLLSLRLRLQASQSIIMTHVLWDTELIVTTGLR